MVVWPVMDYVRRKARVCRSFGRASLFGQSRPSNFQVGLSAIRKDGIPAVPAGFALQAFTIKKRANEPS